MVPRQNTAAEARSAGFSPKDIFVDPWTVLRAAIKAVPAVKYALGIGGIGAVVAIIAGFKIDFRVAVFGTIIILGLMFVLVMFAQQVAARRAVAGGSFIFLCAAWIFTTLTVATPTMLFTCTFFNWPKPLPELLDLNPSPGEKVLVSDTADNSDGRISKWLTCPPGMHVVAGKCRSSDPTQSGPLFITEKQGESTWYCEWQTRVPEGVSLRIQITCDPN